MTARKSIRHSRLGTGAADTYRLSTDPSAASTGVKRSGQAGHARNKPGGLT
jgi:hypothetical protein